jgi:hypothetical protein
MDVVFLFQCFHEAFAEVTEWTGEIAEYSDVYGHGGEYSFPTG